VVAIGVVAASLVSSGPSVPEDLLPPERENRAGPAGDLYEMATAQLDGRPVVVAGAGHQPIRVLDLATGTRSRGRSAATPTTCRQ
jgi:hypothetical protein